MRIPQHVWDYVHASTLRTCLFAPAISTVGAYDQRGARITTSGDSAYLYMHVPTIYDTYDRLRIQYVAGATAASMHVTLTGWKVNVGDTVGSGDWTQANLNIGSVTADELIEFDLSAFYDGIDAGALLVLKVEYSSTTDASNLYTPGWYLRFKPET